VLAGLYYNEIQTWYNHISKRKLLQGAVVAIVANWLFQLYLLDSIDIFMPTIGMAFIAEFSWLLVASSLVIIASLLMPNQSPLLRILGVYSYGIFLLHGALMVKYDFILFRSYLFITFWVYLILVVLLSIVMEEFLFKRVSRMKFLC
jgi:peptidoglycan/LPS O-acetylase OafA/YrhL